MATDWKAPRSNFALLAFYGARECAMLWRSYESLCSSVSVSSVVGTLQTSASVIALRARGCHVQGVSYMPV